MVSRVIVVCFNNWANVCVGLARFCAGSRGSGQTFSGSIVGPRKGMNRVDESAP